MSIFQFEKLLAWQKAKELTIEVYKLLKKFPADERYELCSQIRRAAVSVPSNIAEGSGRVSVKEKIHFLEIAYGSLTEVYCQLLIAVDLGYITTDDVEGVRNLFFDVSRLVAGLSASYKRSQEGEEK